MNQAASCTWSVFSSELSPADFPLEIRGHTSGVVAFLGRIDHYSNLLAGLAS